MESSISHGYQQLPEAVKKVVGLHSNAAISNARHQADALITARQFAEFCRLPWVDDINAPATH